MDNIITAQQFADIRADISKGWQKDKEKIERCISEAQSVDLFDVLDSFFFDVVDNKDEEAYTDLMEGSTFTYNGKRYIHSGLNNYLAGLAYVRYLPLSNATHTPHGYVAKSNQDSERVSYTQIKDIQKDVQKTNEIEFKRIDLYLRANKDTFPNYSTGNNPDINTNSFKTSTLR